MSRMVYITSVSLNFCRNCRRTIHFKYIYKQKRFCDLCISKNIFRYCLASLCLGFPRNGYIFCAKFALFSRKIFFCELLRNFCAWNAMSFARFCAIFFAQFPQNQKYFLRIFAHETKIVVRNLRKTGSITQNVTFSANWQ